MSHVCQCPNPMNFRWVGGVHPTVVVCADCGGEIKPQPPLRLLKDEDDD